MTAETTTGYIPVWTLGARLTKTERDLIADALTRQAHRAVADGDQALAAQSRELALKVLAGAR